MEESKGLPVADATRRRLAGAAAAWAAGALLPGGALRAQSAAQ